MILKSATAVTLTVVFATLAAGCSYLYEPKPVVSKLGHQALLSHTASIKNTMVFERDSTLIFCAEPPPDAAFTQTMDIDFSFALVGSDGDSGDERDETAEMEMDGRTPPIMLARELLYRLCEFSKNHRIDTATAIELYKQNLDIIKGVADTTAENTTITIGETLSTTETVGVEESLPDAKKVGTNSSGQQCPGGQVKQSDGSCGCPGDQVKQSDGSCGCPAGTTLDTDGTCY